MGLLFIIIIVLIVVAICIFCSVRKDKARLKEQLQQEALEEERWRQTIDSLERQYGKRGELFEREGFHLWRYDGSRNLVYYTFDYNKRRVIPYDEITECVLEKQDRILEEIIPAQSETTFVTKTSGKSMVGRAVFGAVVAGPVGAIIGGATAKKTTVGTTYTTPQRTIRQVNTVSCAVIHIVKDGVEDTIQYQGYAASKVKSFIDNIIGKN